MRVKSLTLKNFRNHQYLSCEFNEGINIITGPNGIGKTNIVEAIYYLSLAKSFRNQENETLIQKGKEKAEITATILEGEMIKKAKVTILKDTRQILLNSKPISKISELVKSVNVVLFEPKDVLLFRGSPKERRNFLDVNISKKSNYYLENISQYDKLLRQRNDLLKQDKIDEVLLETTTDLLIKVADPIIAYRTLYVKDINDILNKIARALTGENSKIEIKYTPFVPHTENFSQLAKNAFKGALEGDLKRKATSIGTHREDFSVSLNGRDIAMFGSQGENRLVALALKLSPYFLIEDKDKRPIVVLDDVMSELDRTHRERLIKFLKKMEQVFITATSLTVKDATQFTIK